MYTQELPSWNRLLRTFAVWLSLLLSACVSLPTEVERRPSTALANPGGTPLGQMVGRLAASNGNPSLSGFRVLSAGEDAFAALLALAGQARRTLDLQYYIVHDDASAQKLLNEVRAAAERGVRVRLLIDDLYTSGQDPLFLALASRPNIEVRVFNPFPAGRGLLFTRFLTSAGDVNRIHRRMHNKLFIADNAIAVTGGRNIGDEYFIKSKLNNFVDLDVMVAGRAVPQLSAAFDHFWNSNLAFPIESLKAKAKMPARDELTSKSPPAANEPTQQSSDEPQARALASELARGSLKLTWAPATVLADAPSKIERESEPAPNESIADDLVALMRAAKQEIVMVSPYFVPGKSGIALISELRAKGIKVRLLTNSLAATDAPIVHVGYSRYRPDLLRLGMEIYEFRPTLARPQKRFGSFGSSRASLHAKAVVIDGKILFVGSLNMDPRSALYNTELGLVIRSPALAREVIRLYEDARSESYRVEIDADRIKWTNPDTQEVQYGEPEATASRLFMLMLLKPFAPEEML